jgi:hypothetical protein
MDTERREHLVRFYSILGNLERKIGGARKLADCSGQMLWPRRGVYFFREQGEDRSDTGDGPRVVRVGTHALKVGSSSNFGGVCLNTGVRPKQAEAIIEAQSSGLSSVRR